MSSVDHTTKKVLSLVDEQLSSLLARADALADEQRRSCGSSAKLMPAPATGTRKYIGTPQTAHVAEPHVATFTQLTSKLRVLKADNTALRTVRDSLLQKALIAQQKKRKTECDMCVPTPYHTRHNPTVTTPVQLVKDDGNYRANPRTRDGSVNTFALEQAAVASGQRPSTAVDSVRSEGVAKAHSGDSSSGGAQVTPPWGVRQNVRTGRNKLRVRAKQRKLDSAAHRDLSALLEGSGGVPCAAKLLFRLAGSSGLEASSACWALSMLAQNMPLQQAPDTLLAQFLGAEHPAATRCFAADAVGFLARGDASTNRSLVDACLADDDAKVRRRAALAIGRLRTDNCKDAVGWLTKAICSRSRDGSKNTARIRRHAAQALRSIDGLHLHAPALDQLAKALQDDCPDVRHNAAMALRNVEGATMGTAAHSGPVLVEGLLSALRDPHAKVRQKAALSLGKLGEVAISATAALAVAAADQDCDVRRRAVEALGLVGGAAAAASSARRSSHAAAANDAAAAAAGMAESSMPGAVVTAALEKALLHDSEVVVREKAALALMRVAVAMQTVGGSDERAQSAALSAALSKDESAVVRKVCAWAIETIRASGKSSTVVQCKR
jgi:HEAT repeat protein